VNVILYGDDRREAREIGSVDALEFLMAEAASEMERRFPPEPWLRTRSGPARIAS
jgi:hypothetical protein